MLAIARGLMAQAAHPAARRALARPRAGDDQRAVRRRWPSCATRASRSCSSTRWRRWRSPSPTAAMCWNRAASCARTAPRRCADDPALEAAYLGRARSGAVGTTHVVRSHPARCAHRRTAKRSAWSTSASRDGRIAAIAPASAGGAARGAARRPAGPRRASSRPTSISTSPASSTAAHRRAARCRRRSPRRRAAKRAFTEDDIYARAPPHAGEGDPAAAPRACAPMSRSIRASGCKGFHAIRRLKRDYAWAIDLEICVFPQEGLTQRSRHRGVAGRGLRARAPT